MHPTTDKVLVEENDMITWEAGKEIDKLSEMGLDKVMVRSPMTCQAALGICRLCYGMDLATGSMVEEGMAVGIIAAQSIGEPGTQLTMRTFHIGGVVRRDVVDDQLKVRKPGKLKFNRVTTVLKVGDASGDQRIVTSRNGEVTITTGAKGATTETYAIPYGSTLFMVDGQEAGKDEVICRWDHHVIPIVAETDGIVRYEDIIDGETLRRETDSDTGQERLVILEHRGDRHPQIVIVDDKGEKTWATYLPEKAFIDVLDGQKVSAGMLIAKTTRELGGTQDITGGLPRVTEIFEARRPRDPAVMAEVTGLVRLGDKKRNKRTVHVDEQDERGTRTGNEREHQIPSGKHLRVQNGDYVKAGDPLVHGPLVPHDILAINGIEAVQNYLVREIQSVYRNQRVDIDDKHIEIIVAQMLRKVKVEQMGDTGLLPGSVIDKFMFRSVNERLRDCVKIKSQNDSRYDSGKIISKESYEAERRELEDAGRKPATWDKPAPAKSSPLLLGITKASVQSESFISAASFQETTKVLTEAALAGKVDYLVGLKENVILGHLIPAGTGFSQHQQSTLRVAGQVDGPTGIPTHAAAKA
jgi:DNA-directed RNA polymerase subunit beta'